MPESGLKTDPGSPILGSPYVKKKFVINWKILAGILVIGFVFYKMMKK